MVKKVPALSLFKKGQEVLMGSSGFGIYGVIVDISTKDKLSIKVNANLGEIFELALSDYGHTWFLKDINNENSGR